MPQEQSSELGQLVEAVEKANEGRQELSNIFEEGNEYKDGKGAKAQIFVKDIWEKDQLSFFNDQRKNVVLFQIKLAKNFITMSLTNASEITQTVTPAEGQPGATGRQPGTNEVLESQPGLSFSQPGSSLSQPGSSLSQPGLSQCQPGILYPPDLNLGETLSGINSNMSSMATLLRKVVEHGGLLDNKNPSRTAQKRRTESPELSGSSESEDDADSHPVREKRPRREDELSVGVPSDDDDLKELLTGEDGAENPEVAIAPTEEVEILKSLEADFDDDEPVGQKIQHNLANIASKRWEVSLSNDKLKGLLARHVKPENCADLTVPKVNPEIWSQLDNFKRKADLRLGNIQQALQKATFGILKSCDSQVSNHSSVNKDALEPAIDAIALMGHAVSELSRLRREQSNGNFTLFAPRRTNLALARPFSLARIWPNKSAMLKMPVTLAKR
ncbi:hypothetical protein ACROYT_G014609 [Oculina patagonica]